MADYLDILKDWENKIVNISLYENINIFFPDYHFVRLQAGSQNDHWASPLKLNLDQPKAPNREKTVIYASELCFREQGEWEHKVRVIDKIMEDRELSSVYETYKYIANELGIEMPSTSEYRGVYTKKKDTRLLSLLEEYFCFWLWNNRSENVKKTLAYLRHDRGFTDSAIRKLKFGFVPNWKYVENYITDPRNGYTIEDLERVCNVKGENGSTGVGFEYVLSIPYYAAGELKGFLFRSINPLTVPKYMASKGLDRKSAFFNMKNSPESKDIIIVEGELDALTGTAAGIEGMVAIGGSDLAGERNRMIFDAFNRKVEKITLMLDLDKDKEGRANVKKRFANSRKSILEILRIKPDFRNLFIAELPYPTDPDQFIREEGTERFMTLINEAKPWWNYLADHMNNIEE